MRTTALLCLTALLLSATPSFSQPQSGKVFLRVALGFATQDLEDWNDDIEAGEQTLQSAGIPASFETFGGTMPFSVEAGYQATELLSVSLSAARQSDSVKNSYSDYSGSLSSNADVAMTTLSGNLSYWVPGTRGLFFGADVGVGFGTASSEFGFRDYAAPENDVDITGDWSGNGFVAGAFGGYQHEFSGGFVLHGKLGYQFQNLGEFDGGVSSPQFGSESGPPVNNTGQPMDTDFSGVQLMIGLGVVFGGS